MDIQSSKLELVRLIINSNNEKLIENLLKMLKSEQKDFWSELSESEKEEIRLGIKQLDEGERISLDDFIKKVS